MHLTQAQKDALARGEPMEVVLAMAETAQTEQPNVDAAAQAAADEAAAQAAAQAAPTDAAPTVETLSAQVSELTAKSEATANELASASAQLADANAKLTTAKADLLASQGHAAKLAAVVSGYVTQMSVALGRQVDVSAMTPQQLAEAHDDLRPAMLTAFKAGQQSRATAAAPKADDSFMKSVLSKAGEFKL